jgi:hypothetical protein
MRADCELLKICVMKKSVLLAFLIIFLTAGYAQNPKEDSTKMDWEWAPVGAKWFYTQNLLNPDYTTYTYIESVKDTTINDTICKKLVEYRYDMSNNERVIHTQFFMFKNNSKVYYYSSEKNRFCLLYDFSKQAGEYWILDEFPYSDEEGFDNRVYVDSISNCTINGENRVIQFIHMEDQALCFGNDTIIEGIGNLNYMYPFCELSDIGPLRCYEDDSLDNYHITGTSDCNYEYLAIRNNNNEDSNSVKIYPNPVTNRIKLKLNDYTSRNKYQLEICSLSGQQLFSEDIYRSTILDLSGYAPGIYLLTIKHNNKIIQTEKFIVE